MHWSLVHFRRNCSSAYSHTFLRSVVCLSVCRLSHLCTLLKSFDIFGCHLAGTLVESNTYCVRWSPCPPQRKGRFGAKHPAKIWNCKLRLNRQYYAATRRIQTRSWIDLLQGFRLLPNYFRLCLFTIRIFQVCFKFQFLPQQLSGVTLVFCVGCWWLNFSTRNELKCKLTNTACVFTM